MEPFAKAERVYIAPDAQDAPLELRGRSGLVMKDDGDARIHIGMLDDRTTWSVPREAVRKERRGTWQPPWTYAEVPMPGDDPLGPPRIVPSAP